MNVGKIKKLRLPHVPPGRNPPRHPLRRAFRKFASPSICPLFLKCLQIAKSARRRVLTTERFDPAISQSLKFVPAHRQQGARLGFGSRGGSGIRRSVHDSEHATCWQSRPSASRLWRGGGHFQPVHRSTVLRWSKAAPEPFVISPSRITGGSTRAIQPAMLSSGRVGGPWREVGKGRACFPQAPHWLGTSPTFQTALHMRICALHRPRSGQGR